VTNWKTAEMIEVTYRAIVSFQIGASFRIEGRMRLYALKLGEVIVRICYESECKHSISIRKMSLLKALLQTAIPYIESPAEGQKSYSQSGSSIFFSTF